MLQVVIHVENWLKIETQLIYVTQKYILNEPASIMLTPNTLGFLIKPSIAAIPVKSCLHLQQ